MLTPRALARRARVERGVVDGIVIDQRGHGGGNYLLACVMLARLFERPLVQTKQRYLVRGDEIVGVGPRRALGRLAELLDTLQRPAITPRDQVVTPSARRRSASASARAFSASARAFSASARASSASARAFSA